MATAESIAVPMVTKHRVGRDFSHVPWCVVLGPTAPRKALLSLEGCHIAKGDTSKEHLIWPCHCMKALFFFSRDMAHTNTDKRMICVQVENMSQRVEWVLR